MISFRNDFFIEKLLSHSVLGYEIWPQFEFMCMNYVPDQLKRPFGWATDKCVWCKPKWRSFWKRERRICSHEVWFEGCKGHGRDGVWLGPRHREGEGWRARDVRETDSVKRQRGQQSDTSLTPQGSVSLSALTQWPWSGLQEVTTQRTNLTSCLGFALCHHACPDNKRMLWESFSARVCSLTSPQHCALLVVFIPDVWCSM